MQETAKDSIAGLQSKFKSTSWWQESLIRYFKQKVKVKVNDLGAIWKVIISLVGMPYMKSIFYGSTVIAKVKVDNRQTGQKQYAPIIWSFTTLGIKT